jgi:hypothetical protein
MVLSSETFKRRAGTDGPARSAVVEGNGSKLDLINAHRQDLLVRIGCNIMIGRAHRWRREVGSVMSGGTKLKYSVYGIIQLDMRQEQIRRPRKTCRLHSALNLLHQLSSDGIVDRTKHTA